jgi:1-acyl-sn-glycerol-3-phosphate acyltransferase
MSGAGAALLAMLRSIAFYLVFYGGTILMLFISPPVMALSPRGARWLCDDWSRFHRRCARILLGIHIRVEGPVPLPGVLVAAKHESFFEAIDMPTLIPNPSVFAKAELMRMPIWGTMARHYGLIGVEREAGAKALRAMVAEARQRAGEGRVLVIFPEGTRVPHGEGPALQSGFFGIYKLIGLPVVPMAVDSGALYHRWWKRPGVVTVRFGETIPPGLSREEAEARVYAGINMLNWEG